MPLTFPILVLSAAGFAGPNAPIAATEKPKPECAAATVGKMWPDEANRDTKALRIAAQSGELELCGKHRKGYGWLSLSVNVRQLRTRECCNKAEDLGEIDRAYPPETPSSETLLPETFSPETFSPETRPPDDGVRDVSHGSDRPPRRFRTILRLLGI